MAKKKEGEAKKTSKGKERVAIWSIGDIERMILMFFASILFFPSLSLILWYNWDIVESFYGTVIWKDLIWNWNWKVNPQEKIIESEYKSFIGVLTTIGSVGIFSVTIPFFIIEGVNLMIIPVEKFREYRGIQRKEEREKIFRIMRTVMDEEQVQAVQDALDSQDGIANNQ